MTEEELTQLQQENRLLREQSGLQQETISLQKELIDRLQEQISLLERERSLQQQQLTQLSEQVKGLQERVAKDSHNSHLPPSSDRFGRQPRSLRKKSGKKPGGQEGHPGKTLLFSPSPDEPTSCATRSTLIKHSTSGTKLGRSSVYFCVGILA